MAGRQADRAVPELQGRLGVRPGARRAELRLLRLAGARGLHGDQGADPAAGAAAVQGHRGAGPRADPPVVREQVVRAGQAEEQGARRSRARHLHPVLDVRRAGGAVRGRPRRGTTTTRPRRTATTRATRRRGRSSTCAGSRPRGASSTSSTTSRCRGRTACRIGCSQQVEPFPTPELVPYDTAFLSGFVVEHYQVVLLDAAQSSQEAMTREAARDVRARRCPGDTYRNLRDPPDVLGPDVQAHPRAGLAAVVPVRREDRTRSSSTATPGRWRGSIRRARGRSRSSCCSPSSRSSSSSSCSQNKLGDRRVRQEDQAARRKRMHCRAGAEPSTCRRATTSTARRSSSRFRPAPSARSSALGCFWGAERKFWQLPGVCHDRGRIRRRSHAEPDVPRSLQRHDRSRGGRARRVRSARRSRTTNC